MLTPNLSNQISRNVIWLLSGQIGVKLLGFLFTIFLARELGPALYGVYFYSLTLFGIVSALTDLGLARLVFRDLSVDDKRTQNYLTGIVALSAAVTFPLIILIIVLISLIDRNYNRTLIASIMLVAVLPYTLGSIFASILNAQEKMKLTALATFLLNLIFIMLAVLLLSFNLSVLGVAFAFSLAHFIYLVFLYKQVRLNKDLAIQINVTYWQSTLKRSLPYGILAALGLVYFRMDSIILTLMKGEVVTGYYGAAFRFLDAIHIIPLTIMTAFFPKMARLHQVSVLNLKKLYFKILILMVCLAVPVTFILFFGASLVIKTLYGNEFANSVIALKILSFTTIFMFLHVPGAHLLFASEKNLGKVIFLSFFTVGFNILGNILFIPTYGLVASSVMTLLSEALSFLVFFLLIWFKVFKQK